MDRGKKNRERKKKKGSRRRRRKRRRRRRALREHTHYLNARHCTLYATASSLCTKLLYTPSLVLSLCLSYSHISISYSVLFLSPSFPISTFFFSVFGSLSVAYSECYPTIVKWTIFDSSVLGLDEAAKFSSRKKTFLNGKAKAFQREEHYGDIR